MRDETFLRERHWLKGPDFLMQPQTNWLMLPEVPLVLSDSDPEIKKVGVIFAATALQNQCPLTRFIEHFSSWDKLIRSAAWLFKFKGSLRHLSLQKKANHSLDTSVESDLAEQKLSVEDLAKTEGLSTRKSSFAKTHMYCIALADRPHRFFFFFTKVQSVKRNSRIYKLDPILQNGTLWVRGRLNKLALPEETKHPAILPSDKHFSTLLLIHTQTLVGHCGRNQMHSKQNTGSSKPTQLLDR